jgi:serine protease
MSATPRLKRLSTACLVITAVTALGFIGQCAEAQNQQVENPYSPAYGHPYRHGAVPTREAWQKMNQWWAAHPASGAVAPATPGSGGILTFQGGVNGIGVVSSIPKVYLVFWGSQWVNGGDPNGAATYLQDFYAGIGTGGEKWSGTMTQYCDGPDVATGASSCPSGAPHVGYPSSGSLSNVWFDDSAPVPTDATQAQIAAEAVAAAAHFGNTSAAANRYAQYVIAFPSGADPDGFPNAGFCAWHAYTSSSYGDIPYTNLPYQTDAGTSCGQDFVNSGGTLDGFSIVGGHEYAETLTDELPTGGWCDSALGCSSHEDGDECAWIPPGTQPGGAANVSMGNGAYAMQSTWSNDDDACDISHAIYTPPLLGTPQFTSHTVESCNGAYSVTWSGVTNATSYQILANYPPYTGYGPLKTVGGTTTTLNVANSTQLSYFEVKACDADGCGSASNPLGLRYYSGCLVPTGASTRR